MRGEKRGLLADRQPMALALGVWLCALPFVFLLLAPWLGIKAAGGTALALLVVIAGICWLLCSARDPDIHNGRR